jgi:lycopene cyclase domain-containing protein
MAIIALLYTPIWDNYLVANNIWFYDPSKIIGLLIGFVPIEEYTFFILQSLFVGSVFFIGLIFFSKSNIDDFSPSVTANISSTLVIVSIWGISMLLFLSEIAHFEYLSLILIWGLFPIAIQVLYGFDIIKQQLSLLVIVITLSTFYLSIVDAYAISSGIWTITLATSTGVLLGGILPIEEFVFFLVTNILIVIGLFLLTNQISIKRIKKGMRAILED